MNKLIKIVFLFAIISLSFLRFSAQENTFDWSSPVEKTEEEKLSKIVSLGEKGTLVLLKNKNKKEVRVDAYDKELKFLHSRNIATKGTILECFRLGESLAVFYLYFNPISKKDELNCKLVTTEGEKEVKIAESVVIKNLHNSFKVNVSPNFNYLVAVTEKPHKEGKKEVVVLSLFDKDLNLIRSKSYMMNSIYSMKRKINVPIVNNKGEIYILKRYRAKTQSQYYVLNYTTSNAITFSLFKLNYKPILDAQYALDNEGDLLVGGTFSSPNSKKAEGVYIAKFHASSKPQFRQEYPFRQETMVAFVSEKSLRKNGLGLPNFKTRELLVQKEGYALILEHRERLANAKSSVKIDKRDGIIVLSFDQKGNYIWDVALHFNQYDKEDNGYWNSYICYNDTANNRLIVAYNEVGYFDKKADNNFGEKTTVGARKITISNQGNIEKGIVKDCFVGAPMDLIISPKVSLFNSTEHFIIAEPQDKKLYILGEVGVEG